MGHKIMSRKIEIVGTTGFDFFDSDLKMSLKTLECAASFVNAGQRIKKYTLQFNPHPHYLIIIEGGDEITRIVLTEKKIDFGKFLLTENFSK